MENVLQRKILGELCVETLRFCFFMKHLLHLPESVCTYKQKVELTEYVFILVRKDSGFLFLSVQPTALFSKFISGPLIKIHFILCVINCICQLPT